MFELTDETERLARQIFELVLDRQRMLPMLYASADAFLFSSLTETLGLVVLEAMSSGLPVIACPAGGVADHLRDGQNGIAVPPDDPAMTGFPHACASSSTMPNPSMSHPTCRLGSANKSHC